MWRFWMFALALWVVFICPAKAFIGEVDAANRFPYVVLLWVKGHDGEENKGYACTAVVVARRLALTAAHCVWSEGKFHQRPNLRLWDSKKKQMRDFPALDVYVKPVYIEAATALAEKQAQYADLHAQYKAGEKEVTGSDLNWFWRHNSEIARKPALNDIAVIITAEDMLLPEYAFTTLHLDQGFYEYLWGGTNTPPEWTKEKEKGIISLLKNPERFLQQTAIGAGFGLHDCSTQQWKENVCQLRDPQRRWSKVELDASQVRVSAPFELYPVFYSRGKAPDAHDSSNSFLGGDSGGPLFMLSRSSEMSVLVGVTSAVTEEGDGDNRGIHASLIYNAPFIYEVVRTFHHLLVP